LHSIHSISINLGAISCKVHHLNLAFNISLVR